MNGIINILRINPYWILILSLILIWFFWKERRWIYIIHKTWRRDLKGMWMIVRAMYKITKFEKNDQTIPKIFSKLAQTRPNKVALYFEDEMWTFQQLEDFSNKVANYFISAGYRKGDVIALLLENRPEYVAIWLGLSKLGIITAFLNTNLVSKPLIHCINVASVKSIIFGNDFIHAVSDISPELDGDIKLIQFNTSIVGNLVKNSIDFKQCLIEQSISSPDTFLEKTHTKDKVLYIYTSGTTGLPKAAKITHARFIFTVTGINSFLNFQEDDILYNPLPLYHATGGMLTIGQSIIFGVPIVIRKKFSASAFWTDCNKYKCTVANYIGETCRYILAANKGQTSIKHGVKKMFGNGLKKEIWKEFVDTFNISSIREFYGSTEGNSNLINLDDKIGSVGFVPFYLSPFVPVCLIKCDDETNEPLKNSEGFCIECKINESGLLIGKINKRINTQTFDGYVDNKDTNKKVLNNVFKLGDSYYNSGDLMVKDDFGYIYFKDRTGDTYRWKGENVATTEIEYLVSEIIGPKNAVVYGVEVPYTEGKAGMIAIADPSKSINTKTLAEGLKSSLPSYAIPLFLRIMDSLPLTGTFKVKKTELQKDGFDINNVRDSLYLYNAKLVDYIPLRKFYEDIVTGQHKL